MRLPLRLPSADGRRHDLLALGANSIDLLTLVDSFPVPNGKQPMAGFAEVPGGEAATAAVTVVRLGFTARYIGRFGRDRFGRMGLASLARAGVDVGSAITTASAASQFAVILVEATTGDRSVIYRRERGIALLPEDVPSAAAAAARVLLADGHAIPAAIVAATAARAAGTPTVLDLDDVTPGLDRLIALSDIVFAAAGLPERLTGRESPGAALAAIQRDSGATIVGVTLGPEGSLTRVGGHEIHTPGFAIEVVDTTGAGDAFRGGFIGGWLAQGDGAVLEDVLRFAHAVAALSCRGLGARSALPARADVESLLSGSWTE
ncbi:MAG: hypothetical protein IT307_07145 [Chloroflexi bacterium]|nr:hypothetical protein [Chloroflexota bacterium]